MKLTLFYFAILSVVFSCTPAEIDNAELAEIRYCRNCIEQSDAIEFENKIGSERLELPVYEISAIWGKVTYALSTRSQKRPGSENRKIFKRKSTLAHFSEFVLYEYKGYQNNQNTLHSAGAIDFNLGNSALGFEKDTSSIPGKEYMTKPVNPISLEDFKAGYYSILKWFYSLETDKRKVVKKKIRHFDHARYSSPEIELEDMVIEDPWQEEFLFYAYELRDTENNNRFVWIEPQTYAPITLYEKRSDYYKRGEGYHINLSDMSIRIMFSAEFTGLDKAL